jgi:hypothetical protein
MVHVTYLVEFVHELIQNWVPDNFDVGIVNVLGHICRHPPVCNHLVR